jgi:serine protease Do
VIITADGQPVDRVSTLQRIVRNHNPGETIELEAMRYGQRKTFRVTLMEAKTDEVASAAVPAATGTTGVLHPALGISVAPVSPEIAAQARLASPVRGVLVSDVTPGGPGDQKLFPHDVITEVLFPAPRRAVNTPAELQQVLSRLKDGDYVSLSVYSLDDRLHQPRIVNLQLGN